LEDLAIDEEFLELTADSFDYLEVEIVAFLNMNSSEHLLHLLQNLLEILLRLQVVQDHTKELGTGKCNLLLMSLEELQN